MADVQGTSTLREINAAFEQLKDFISKEDNRSFSTTTLEEVWNAAKDIERHLEERRSQTSYPLSHVCHVSGLA